uniref:TFIIS-type domain-containing protein n=1 Tax=viral metagenome TaxID=1070528 RepID=A0A6C0F7Q6_9ZZZZ
MNNASYNDENRKQMIDKLAMVTSDKRTAMLLEQGIYNHVIKISREKQIIKRWSNPFFEKLYRAKVLSIYTHMKPDSYIKNETFCKKVDTHEIDPRKVGSMSNYDLFPEAWKELLDQKTKRDRLKYELKPEAMTDVFKCHRCGSRSCSYYEVQTRSADEPMTQFINCLDCGNRWKQ